MANMTTSVVIELVDRVTRPVRRITASLSGLSQRTGFDRLSASARRVGSRLGEVTERAKGLGQNLLWMTGITAGAAYGAERFVSGVTDVGTAVQESAERVKVGTTWLQEWFYVGKQFGVGNDALVDGLKELSMRADEFVMTAGGPAAEAFQRLGIGVDELRATGGDTAAMFDLVRSRLGNLENDAARQRVMDEIFGGQGAEQMVAMLGASREEIEAMKQAGRDKGAILTPEEIENSREYTRQMGDLKQVLFGIQASVVGDLLPAINDWIGGMGDLGAANREAVSERIISAIRDIAGGIKRVWEIVSWAADAVGGFGNLLMILAGVMAGRLLLAIGRTVLALFGMGKQLILMSVRAIPAAIAGVRALGMAFLTTPIGWIVAGIAAVAGAAYLIYKNWDGISEWFGNLWGSIKAFFDRGIGEIVADLLAFSPAGLLMKGIDAVFELFGARPLSEIGQEWIGGLWTGIEGQWSELTSWLSTKVTELTEWMPDWAKERLGLGGMEAPKPSGAPVAGGESRAMPGPARADVGGELRIVVDSEGRPRIAEARRNGGMDFDVESGVLGVAP